MSSGNKKRLGQVSQAVLALAQQQPITYREIADVFRLTKARASTIFCRLLKSGHLHLIDASNDKRRARQSVATQSQIPGCELMRLL